MTSSIPDKYEELWNTFTLVNIRRHPIIVQKLVIMPFSDRYPCFINPNVNSLVIFLFWPNTEKPITDCWLKHFWPITKFSLKKISIINSIKHINHYYICYGHVLIRIFIYISPIRRLIRRSMSRKHILSIDLPLVGAPRKPTLIFYRFFYSALL